VLRRLPVLTRYQGRDYPMFAATLIDCARAPNAASVLPLAAGASWRSPYPRAWPAYTVAPAAEVLAQRLPTQLLAGRYVLVGSSSLSLGDHVSTPLAPLNAGVLVHANALSALLDIQAGRGGLPWSGRAGLAAWVLLSVALLAWAMPRVPAWGNIAGLAALTAGWLALGLWGARHGAEWSLSAPLAAYLCLLATAIPCEWWGAQQRYKRLLSTFSRYVGPSVLNEMVRRGLEDSLTPTQREVTVLIADMEGFTRTTAALPLTDAARLTHDFLQRLTGPVLAHSGTLDKYTGDGLVAFWGAPLPCPEQADQAAAAALDIVAAVAALNQQRHADGLPTLRVRIGIESGLALVGDLGTSFRSSYTAIGDCINFASRLESAARTLPADIIIGSEAASRITQHTLIPLGSLQLRGTESMMAVFTVGQGHAG
jgi:adenylate cyclase